MTCSRCLNDVSFSKYLLFISVAHAVRPASATVRLFCRGSLPSDKDAPSILRRAIQNLREDAPFLLPAAHPGLVRARPDAAAAGYPSLARGLATQAAARCPELVKARAVRAAAAPKRKAEEAVTEEEVLAVAENRKHRKRDTDKQRQAQEKKDAEFRKSHTKAEWEKKLRDGEGRRRAKNKHELEALRKEKAEKKF